MSHLTNFFRNYPVFFFGIISALICCILLNMEFFKIISSPLVSNPDSFDILGYYSDSIRLFPGIIYALSSLVGINKLLKKKFGLRILYFLSISILYYVITFISIASLFDSVLPGLGIVVSSTLGGICLIFLTTLIFKLKIQSRHIIISFITGLLLGFMMLFFLEIKNSVFEFFGLTTVFLLWQPSFAFIQNVVIRQSNHNTSFTTL